MKDTNKIYDQLVKKANSKFHEKTTMPKITEIALLLKEKNVNYKLWDFLNGEYYLEVFDAHFTMKNKSPYYSRNTRYYAEKIVSLIK